MEKIYHYIPQNKDGKLAPIICATLDKNASPYTFTSWGDAEVARRFIFDGPEKRAAFDRSPFYLSRFER